MPCTVPVRAKNDIVRPWSPITDNDPCGMPSVQSVGGVDVSAQNLCYPHYALKYGIPSGALVIDPPAAPSGGGIDAQTVLLLHGGSLADSSPSGKAVTANGDAKVSSAQSKFGGSALLFDGAGDWLSVPFSPDWQLGAGDFTIDFWMRANSFLPSTQIVGQWTNAGAQGSWFVQFTGAGNLQFAYSLDGTPPSYKAFTWGAALNTWYHVAVVRNGNNLMCFVNGVQIGATQDLTGVTIFPATSVLTVGGNNSTTQYFNGYLDELRVSKGIARWTAPFSVPTVPYS